MTAFNPGDGWRRLGAGEAAEGREMLEVHPAASLDGANNTLWVRVDSAPALPTEPYTVIRVTWKDTQRHGVLTLVDGEKPMWLVAANITNYRNPTQVAEEIDGFEVLSEPRAVTAKIVIERFQELRTRHAFTDAAVMELENEFGVRS